MIKSFISVCLAHSRTGLMFLSLILVSGVYAYVTIPKESNPDITVPWIYVAMVHEGISPEDGERLLVRPMEKELRSIEGVKEMTARATEGSASVTLEFEAGFDIDEALNDVREAVDLAKPELPDETEEPIVNEINLALEPVITISLSGDVPERQLVRLARNLKDELEGIGEVLEVDIGGDREEVVEILVDPVVLDTYDLKQVEIFATAERNNKLVAAGTLDSGAGRIPIKVPGLFESVNDILELPVKVIGDSVVTLQDIGVVRRTFKDPGGFARVDGLPAVTLEVKKRVGENVIDAVDKTKALIEVERQNWPEGLSVSYSNDQSKDIKEMLTDLQNNVISAIILVMIVVVAALGWRTGLLVGIAIPGSFLAGILVLSALGLTVNVVVLFSLILSVGMLVDGAIVVTEFADRKMSEGIPRKNAYLQASVRMSLPIIASTVTTLAAFMPLLFWPGIIGEFMKFLPITLIATLTASLFMALVFVPTLGGIFGKPGPASPETMRSLDAAEGGSLDDLTGFTGWYVRILRRILHHPVIVVIVAIVSLFSVAFLYGKFGKGVEFFPDVEPPSASLLVRMRGNLSVWEIDKLVREVEEEVLRADGVKSVYARSKASFRGGNFADDVHGIIQLEFEDWQVRDKADKILERIRERTQELDGLIITERKQEAGPPTGKAIQIEFSSKFPQLIEPALVKTLGKMESMKGLKDIEDARAVPGIEWQINVDRAESSRYGADIALVGNAVQFVTNGLNVGTYRPDGADDEIDIKVRYPQNSRHLDQIEQLRVATAAGLVPIKNFIQRKAAPKVGKIDRTDSHRVLEISAEVEPGVLPDEKVKELRKWMEEEANLNPDVNWKFRGEDEEQEKSKAFLMKAFLVALFMMGIILVTQFNSFYQAFLILTAVVFSTVGVFLGLLITGQPFGIVMAGIGVISLAGIVVNNNIVLIDTFDYHILNGAPTFDAVLRTASQRLRPVLLTTVTTILGLLPMVFKVNIDFFTRNITYDAPSTQWWTQLATTVAFGLAFATLLTLVLTPALLVLGDKLYKSNILQKGELTGL